MLFRRIAVFVALAGLMYVSPAASAVLIDNFDAGTVVVRKTAIAGTTVLNAGTAIAAGNTIGNYRKLHINGAGPAPAAVISLATDQVNNPGLLDLTASSTGRGTSAVIWDANNGVAGLGGVNLKPAGEVAFRFKAFADLSSVGMTFKLSITDTANVVSSYVWNAINGSQNNYIVLFTAMTNAGTVDLTSTKFIRFEIMSTTVANDAEIDFLESAGAGVLAVPEPSGIALLVIGASVIGVAQMRRRRNSIVSAE